MLAASSSSSAAAAGGSVFLLTRLLPHARHCFVSLPPGVFSTQLAAREQSDSCMVLSLEWNDAPSSSPASSAAPPPVRRLYVGWRGEVLRDSAGAEGMGCIGLPKLFADSLGLVAGVRIHVQLVPDRIAASMNGAAHSAAASSSSALGAGSRELVSLEPLSVDEWEILELNAGAVELGLLAQIQVLNPGQTFPLWIGGGGDSGHAAKGGVCIRMKHASAGAGRDLLGGKSSAAPAQASVPFFKLTLHSEVNIIPKPRPKKGAPASSSAAPTGPPPPVAKLRVQPWLAGAIGREVARQRREQREQNRRERLRIQESKVREWESLRGIDLERPLLPLDAASSSAAAAAHAAPSSCTLLSPHYVHVSAATLRYLQVAPHDLVVLSYQRRVVPTVSIPAPPQPAFIETYTSVLRIAESLCVVESEAGALPGASFASTHPHHILLPPSLRLGFHCADFEWVHVQKLTPAAAAGRAAGSSPLAQRMRVQESTQRLQSIRLRELYVQTQLRDGGAATNQPTQVALSQNQQSATLSAAAAAEDAQSVSEAFLNYVRAASNGSEDADSILDASAALPVPLVNGACISLLVPTRPSVSHGTAAAPLTLQRRFFSVHFNEVELLKAAPSARGSAGASDAAAATDDDHSPSSTHGGVKVNMATSYFMLREPRAGSNSSTALTLAEQAHGKKSKKKHAPTLLPLPTPLVHPSPQVVTIEVNSFDDGDIDDGVQNADVTALDDASVLDASDVEILSSLVPSPAHSSALSLEELGGGPDFHRLVVAPLWRFLKNALCKEYIMQRAALVAGTKGPTESVEPRSDALVRFGTPSPPPPPTAAAAAAVATAATAAPSLGGFMLVGSSGLGKSVLLRSLCRKLRSSNEEVGVLAQTVWVDCKEKVHQKVSELRAWLHRLLFKQVLAASPGPVLLVLEDLDQLLPAPSGDPGSDGGAGLRISQQAEAFYDVLTAFWALHPQVPVAILAICASASSHHPMCNLLFPHVVSMANPSLADRQDMIVKLVAALSRRSPGASGGVPLSVKISRKVDLPTIARRTEGYTAADMKQLVTRVLHAALMRSMQHPATQLQLSSSSSESNGALQVHDYSSSSSSLSTSAPSAPAPPSFLLLPSDFDTAFRGFVPSALKELALQDGGSDPASTEAPTAGWESIGGMFNLKRTLLDTLELPTRYAALFAAAPLKLRSGLLLYGPPGCGKTMLASHVAAKCGLNFLSVKGPELLNKYIGSSEQNVRDIFARARAAAPALLFFDEMDSIVPKRGGDSTGVTDRVVNQFLCELDGVEGAMPGAEGAARKQLYVLGASSRPDLIDPALLRPGRLDKALYCGLPDHAERADMLRRMLSTLAQADDVDVEVLAARTEEYTPADLQAIVTNAQMDIVQEAIRQAHEEAVAQQQQKAGARGGATGGAKPAATVLPPLSQAHLLRSLDASKPSTSAAERARFDKIYQKFRLNRAEGPVDFDPKAPQRQALG